ncbi:hypothetical protein SLA2020_049600 [Shorea laevis]
MCVTPDCFGTRLLVVTASPCHDPGIDTSVGKAHLLSVPHCTCAHMGVGTVTPCHDLDTSNLHPELVLRDTMWHASWTLCAYHVHTGVL